MPLYLMILSSCLHLSILKGSEDYSKLHRERSIRQIYCIINDAHPRVFEVRKLQISVNSYPPTKIAMKVIGGNRWTSMPQVSDRTAISICT